MDQELRIVPVFTYLSKLSLPRLGSIDMEKWPILISLIILQDKMSWYKHIKNHDVTLHGLRFQLIAFCKNHGLVS